MYSERSVEDLKERYYSIAEKLERVHGGATAPDQVKPNLVGGGGGEGVSWRSHPPPGDKKPSREKILFVCLYTISYIG